MGTFDNFFTAFNAFMKFISPYLPIVLILGGLVLAVFIDYLIKRTKKYIIKNKIAKDYQLYKQIPFAWQSLKILFSSIRSYVFFWIFILSIYSAIIYSFGDRLSIRQTYYLSSIMFILFIFSLTWLTADFAARVIHARSKILASTSIFISIIRISIYLLGVLVILNYFNQDITWLLGTLGIAGLAVALALQDTLSNFFAGLYIIASRQIKPGHYIKLDSGEEGTIIDINWRSTTLQAMANHIIIIPNSKIGSATITNYHLPAPPVNLYIPIGVHYESDLEHVEKICLEVARELVKNPDLQIDKTFEPIVRYNTFDDSSINFNVIIRSVDYFQQFLIKHEYMKAIHERFTKEGITIPYPIRTIEFDTDLKLSKEDKEPT